MCYCLVDESWRRTICWSHLQVLARAKNCRHCIFFYRNRSLQQCGNGQTSRGHYRYSPYSSWVVVASFSFVEGAFTLHFTCPGARVICLFFPHLRERHIPHLRLHLHRPDQRSTTQNRTPIYAINWMKQASLSLIIYVKCLFILHLILCWFAFVYFCLFVCLSSI